MDKIMVIGTHKKFFVDPQNSKFGSENGQNFAKNLTFWHTIPTTNMVGG